MSIPGLEAAESSVGQGVSVGRRTRIVAARASLGAGVHVGDDVTIACDELVIGPGARIGDGCRILSPAVTIGALSRIGAGMTAELHGALILGRLSDVGRSVRIVGHRFTAGDHLWLTDAVQIGGGGARGARSDLTLGDRCAVMDRCFLNISEPVSIGDDTALSNGVTILTHSLWQPVLDGGTARFAPVRIGSRCILYVNAVVAPGVTIGDDVTVAAGALVLQDVPDASTAVGNPARVMRSTPPVPRELPAERRSAMMLDILREWADTLAVKGVSAAFDGSTQSVSIAGPDPAERVRFISTAAPPAGATITLAFGPAAPHEPAACHFDLSKRTVSGDLSPLGEDLRDYLRRRTIRIYSDRPFESLPPASIARLRARLG